MCSFYILVSRYQGRANISGVRTQILIIYASKYPIPVLMKLHKPYEKLTPYQVKRARKHAKLYGPGTIPENELQHRTRLDMGKVDHFLEFANRPYYGLWQPNTETTQRRQNPHAKCSPESHAIYYGQAIPKLLRRRNVSILCGAQLCLKF